MCILGRNKPSFNGEETDLSPPKPQGEAKQVNHKAYVTRSAINAPQTITIPPMAQAPVFLRFQLPDLVHTEPKHSVFVNHLLRPTKRIHEIDPHKPFIVVVGNFSNIPRKIPKHMIL